MEYFHGKLNADHPQSSAAQRRTIKLRIISAPSDGPEWRARVAARRSAQAQQHHAARASSGAVGEFIDSNPKKHERDRLILRIPNRLLV